MYIIRIGDRYFNKLLSRHHLFKYVTFLMFILQYFEVEYVVEKKFHEKFYNFDYSNLKLVN